MIRSSSNLLHQREIFFLMWPSIWVREARSIRVAPRGKTRIAPLGGGQVNWKVVCLSLLIMAGQDLNSSRIAIMPSPIILDLTAWPWYRNAIAPNDFTNGIGCCVTVFKMVKTSQWVKIQIPEEVGRIIAVQEDIEKENKSACVWDPANVTDLDAFPSVFRRSVCRIRTP